MANSNVLSGLNTSLITLITVGLIHTCNAFLSNMTGRKYQTNEDYKLMYFIQTQ